MTFSAVSTISTTIGRSSESRRILEVWMCELAPNPSIPRTTVAPARPVFIQLRSAAASCRRPSRIVGKRGVHPSSRLAFAFEQRTDTFEKSAA